MSRKRYYQNKPGHTELGIWAWNDIRFWEKVKKSPDPNGCWIWQGAMSPAAAIYGAYKAGRQQMIQSRRIAHMSTYKEDIGDYAVSMTCHRTDCVAPHHFQLVDNMLGPRKAYLNVKNRNQDQ